MRETMEPGNGSYWCSSSVATPAASVCWIYMCAMSVRRYLMTRLKKGRWRILPTPWAWLRRYSICSYWHLIQLICWSIIVDWVAFIKKFPSWRWTSMYLLNLLEVNENIPNSESIYWHALDCGPYSLLLPCLVLRFLYLRIIWPWVTRFLLNPYCLWGNSNVWSILCLWC